MKKSTGALNWASLPTASCATGAAAAVFRERAKQCDLDCAWHDDHVAARGDLRVLLAFSTGPANARAVREVEANVTLSEVASERARANRGQQLLRKEAHAMSFADLLPRAFETGETEHVTKIAAVQLDPAGKQKGALVLLALQEDPADAVPRLRCLLHCADTLLGHSMARLFVLLRRHPTDRDACRGADVEWPEPEHLCRRGECAKRNAALPSLRRVECTLRAETRVAMSKFLRPSLSDLAASEEQQHDDEEAGLDRATWFQEWAAERWVAGDLRPRYPEFGARQFRPPPPSPPLDAAEGLRISLDRGSAYCQSKLAARRLHKLQSFRMAVCATETSSSCAEQLFDRNFRPLIDFRERLAFATAERPFLESEMTSWRLKSVGLVDDLPAHFAHLPATRWFAWNRDLFDAPASHDDDDDADEEDVLRRELNAARLLFAVALVPRSTSLTHASLRVPWNNVRGFHVVSLVAADS